MHHEYMFIYGPPCIARVWLINASTEIDNLVNRQLSIVLLPTTTVMWNIPWNTSCSLQLPGFQLLCSRGPPLRNGHLSLHCSLKVQYYEGVRTTREHSAKRTLDEWILANLQYVISLASMRQQIRSTEDSSVHNRGRIEVCRYVPVCRYRETDILRSVNRMKSVKSGQGSYKRFEDPTLACSSNLS